MQVFRLVQPGIVDKVIAFDELPADLVAGINQREPSGMPRHWRQFAPSFYVLEYIAVNNDKEKWSKISSYVRQAVDPSFRLLDKLEDMARPLASDSKVALELEPEDVPVIPIGAKEEEEIELEPALTEAPRRGRPRKNTEA